VYQDYKLVDFLSIADNLLLAAEMRGLNKSRADAERALSTVGLDHLNPTRLPATLSGGEQQRVAIARAVICESEALIADEPTGALDASTTDVVTDLLLSLATETSTMVLVATHDPRVADRMPARFELREGQLRRVR
jgi:ABC-type lipoprotein export system ATPase subunit